MPLFVASRKGLFRFTEKAGSWRSDPPAFLGEPVSAVLVDPRDGVIYAALRLGHFGNKLHRSTDNGKTWTELKTPALPADPTAKDGAAPAVDMIWTLVAGGTDQPGELWAGTLPGALFRSTDQGATWSLVEGLWNRPERKEWMGGGYDLSGLHTILVDPVDPKRLTIAVSTGGVWRSDDRGKTWRLVGKGLRNAYMPPERAYEEGVQDVHRLARSPSLPNVLWCQHHNGIFRSINGGDTFTEIVDVKPSVFGFAVAAHPKIPDIAWFVPAIKDERRVAVDGRLVVNRTSDGGKTFEQLGSGLPEKDCFDLIYRHGLDVDATGETLAMGSTTGNLWVGRGGGKRWTLVSAHLPPIAQVAFA